MDGKLNCCIKDVKLFLEFSGEILFIYKVEFLVFVSLVLDGEC